MNGGYHGTCILRKEYVNDDDDSRTMHMYFMLLYRRMLMYFMFMWDMQSTRLPPFSLDDESRVFVLVGVT